MTAPTVEFSDAYLARFSDEERGPAQLAMIDMIDKITMGMATVYGKDIREDLKAGYFDPDAVVTLHYKSSGTNDMIHQRLPIMTFLAAADNADDMNWIRAYLAPIIKTHPNMNDEMGDGSFTTPLGCALFERTLDLTMLELLSHNPHVDPTRGYSGGCSKVIHKRGESGGETYGAAERDALPRNLIQELIGQYHNITGQNYKNHGPMICRFFDNGAPVPPDVRKDIRESSRAGAVMNHIDRVEEHLNSVDALNCTLQDIKHGYALSRLTPWFEHALTDDDAREHLLALREEMPAWLSGKLSGAYELLGVTNWVERSGGDNGPGFTGRFK